MRGTAFRAGALAIGLLLIGAKAPDPRSYETEWIVTQDVAPEFLAGRAIGRNTEIFRQKIRFERLATADIALTEAANGEVFVPAGEQYYKAATEGPELWCTANMKMPEGAFATAVVGRVYSQYCILDHDKDGTFDSFFKRARTIEVLPTVRGKITPNPRPIRPLRLVEADPASLRTDYYLGLVYFKNSGKAGAETPMFQRFAGSEHGRFLLERPFKGDGGDNRTLSLEGAQVVYSIAGEGIAVHSVRPYASGAVRLVGTECGMINGC
jgi:hypothetical protein